MKWQLEKVAWLRQRRKEAAQALARAALAALQEATEEKMRQEEALAMFAQARLAEEESRFAAVKKRALSMAQLGAYRVALAGLAVQQENFTSKAAEAARAAEKSAEQARLATAEAAKRRAEAMRMEKAEEIWREECRLAEEKSADEEAAEAWRKKV